MKDKIIEPIIFKDVEQSTIPNFFTEKVTFPVTFNDNSEQRQEKDNETLPYDLEPDQMDEQYFEEEVEIIDFYQDSEEDSDEYDDYEFEEEEEIDIAPVIQEDSDDENVFIFDEDTDIDVSPIITDEEEFEDSKGFSDEIDFSVMREDNSSIEEDIPVFEERVDTFDDISNSYTAKVFEEEIPNFEDKEVFEEDTEDFERQLNYSNDEDIPEFSEMLSEEELEPKEEKTLSKKEQKKLNKLQNKKTKQIKPETPNNNKKVSKLFRIILNVVLIGAFIVVGYIAANSSLVFINAGVYTLDFALYALMFIASIVIIIIKLRETLKLILGKR